MDISAITALNSVNGTATVSPTSLTGMLAEKEKKAEGTMFETFLNTAIDNVKITNSYLSDAENEKIRFALGETDNTHDLTIAMDKASTALQYTVAIRDKVMEAYKELIVRVAGYSDYFRNLDKPLQNEIIERTEQSFGGCGCC